MPAIELCPLEPAPGIDALFEVNLLGFCLGETLKLILEKLPQDVSSTEGQMIGYVEAKLKLLKPARSGDVKVYCFESIKNHHHDAQTEETVQSHPDKRLIALRFAQILEPSRTLLWSVPLIDPEKDEGETWVLRLRGQLNGLTITSGAFPVAKVRRSLTVGKQATYHWHAGNTVKFYNDGSTDGKGREGAFADIFAAIRQAEHFIFIADWSFHPFLRVDRFAPLGAGNTIGALLLRQAQAGVLVAIHAWDHTSMAMPDPPNDEAHAAFDWLAEKLNLSRENLIFRMSSRKGIGWSHHQKFIVLDTEGEGGRRELMAFIGGLDLTKGRFDWPDHPILSLNPGDGASRLIEDTSKQFKPSICIRDVNDWYSAEFENVEQDDHAYKVLLPRQPWHDIHARVKGPTAWDLAREFVGRWRLDPSIYTHKDEPPIPLSASMSELGQVLLQREENTKRVTKKFEALFERTSFIQQEEPRPGRWVAQIYRSLEGAHWAKPLRIGNREEFKWVLQSDHERSIQDAYLQAIDQAKRFIYIENQYLVGSEAKYQNGELKKLWERSMRFEKSILFKKKSSFAANRVPEAIVERIVGRAQEGRPFHVYIILPMFPEGDPLSAASMIVRGYTWQTIQFMIKNLQERLWKISKEHAWTDYLSFYFLAQWHGHINIRWSGGRVCGPGVGPGGFNPRQRLVAENRRYMIYIHSKAMIVDDRYVILGSANLNERGLSGNRDSEICIGLWPASPVEVEMSDTNIIQDLRRRLWMEHLGIDLSKESWWKTPESRDAIARVRSIGDRNWSLLHHNNPTPPAGCEKVGHLVRWPFWYEKKRPLSLVPIPQHSSLIPDYPENTLDALWDINVPDLEPISRPKEWGADIVPGISVLEWPE